MGFLRKLFGREQPKFGHKIEGPGLLIRTYTPAVARTESNFDFLRNGLGEDGALFAAGRSLVEQSRALCHTNGIAGKYIDTNLVNVIGSEGYTLQMRIMDKDPRVDEGKRVAGAPDVFANTLIERHFKRAGRAEFCTIGGKLNRQQVRELRLSQTIRDGAVFVRKHYPQDNPYRYAVEIINLDSLAFNYCETFKDGYEVRMGVGRDINGRTTAYYFLPKKDQDWRLNASTSWPQGYATNARSNYIRVPAEEIILSCRYTDADATLAAPWITPAMQLLHQIEAYTEAEIIASRAAACKGGFLKNTMTGETGEALADLKGANGEKVQIVGPNEIRELPYGWEFVPYDPKHPTAVFPASIKSFKQAAAVALRVPYYAISGDLADANYSSLQCGERDVRETWKMIQGWDIACNELPSAEVWLRQSLSSPDQPLGMSYTRERFNKFNRFEFRGRRWGSVNPLDEMKAAEMALKMGLKTKTEVISDLTQRDFEELIEEREIEEQMIVSKPLFSAWLKEQNAKAPAAPQAPATQEDDKPANQNGNRLNGVLAN